MAEFSLFAKLLDMLPRDYLNMIAREHANVRDPLPIVRSSLKDHIMAADSRVLRIAMATWIVKQLLPDSTLDLQ